jgi:hypothetical protein
VLPNACASVALDVGIAELGILAGFAWLPGDLTWSMLCWPSRRVCAEMMRTLL